MLFRSMMNTVLRSARLAQAAARRFGLLAATRMHRATLASVGRGSRFQPGVHFAYPQQVSVGENCYFWRGCQTSTEAPDAQLVIDDGVQINRDVHLDTTGGLTLGAGVLISEGVVIYTHDHGLDPRAAPRMLPKTIGADAWIGMRAVIMPQCRRIGAGAVIGAGAIVISDVPPNAIVAGNPGRVVRYREPQEAGLVPTAELSPV